jgi:hypothetical protein
MVRHQEINNNFSPNQAFFISGLEISISELFF